MIEENSKSERIIRVFHELQVERSGNGRSLILVHGIQGTLENWHPVIPELRDLSCVMVNLPGRGSSPRCQIEEAHSFYNVDHFADLIDLLIEAEVKRTGEPVSVAGWSMGVTVLLRLWERHGGRNIKRIAFLSGTPLAGMARWFKSECVQGIELEARDRAVRLGLTNVADPIAVAWALKSARQLDQRSMLASIQCEVLVLHGECDDQSPMEHGQMIANGIKGARFVMLPEVGHSILASSSKVVGRELRGFFLG